MAISLKTIAQQAGVSTATVSNVINGNFNKVSQETIARVQKIVEENNYKPNSTARSLASKKSRIIGVVIPHLSPEEDFMLSPYNAHMLALLEKFIRNHGYYMMMRCVGRCIDIVPSLSSWNVDGMIFFGAFLDEISEIETHHSIPAVYIDSYATELGISNVGIDDYKGGYLSAGYLIGRGHRDIAFVGPSVNYPGVIQQRFHGFRDACSKAGIWVNDDQIFETNTLYESGVIAGQRVAMAYRNFTAVACMSDIVAMGVIDGLRSCGKSVPQDVSVIGFDNLSESNYCSPKLTTISQNLSEKANAACASLFRQIQKPDEKRDQIWLDVELVERQSVIRIN